MGGASDLASQAMGGPFMGGHSSAAYGDVRSDGSGWSVNVGSGSASADASGSRNSTSSRTQPQAGEQFAQGIGYPAAAGNGMGGIEPLALVAAAGIVLVAFLLRR
jgi:hypothetical protein